jgi:SAM-dependent methyltransferase
MARYTHGHSESVLRSHTWRTAENSCAYLLDDLGPGVDLLDVGCGPGTTTTDLALIVAPGRVVGVDTSHDVLLKASELASARGVTNTMFEPADVYALPYGNASFDVVHAHQVLQHLDDPVAAIREMRRVLRPHGVLAVRDVDYGGMRWFPRLPGLDEWLDLYQQVSRRNGGEGVDVVLRRRRDPPLVGRRVGRPRAALAVRRARRGARPGRRRGPRGDGAGVARVGRARGRLVRDGARRGRRPPLTAAPSGAPRVDGRSHPTRWRSS